MSIAFQENPYRLYFSCFFAFSSENAGKLADFVV